MANIHTPKKSDPIFCPVLSEPHQKARHVLALEQLDTPVENGLQVSLYGTCLECGTTVLVYDRRFLDGDDQGENLSF